MSAELAFTDHGGQEIEFFIGGRPMMESVAAALESATRAIYIAGWRLNPFQKLRPLHHDPAIRDQTLRDLLHGKAAEGVAARVLLWDSPGSVMGTGDEEVIRRLRKMPEVEVVADEVGYDIDNSHHQKFVVVDDEVAFVGGIDLAGGRWDEPPYPLFPGRGDPRLSDFKSDFIDDRGVPDEAKECRDWLGIYDFAPQFDANPNYAIPARDGTCCPRLAWHDVHARVKGAMVKDLSKVFCGRWNKLNGWFAAMGRTKSKLRVDLAPVTVSEPTATARVVLSIDSASYPFSERTTVRSYQEAYETLISEAESSIYIESQYFISAHHRAGYRHDVVNALIARLKRAVSQDEDLRVVIVVPVHPNGDPNDATTREHYFWQQETIKQLSREVGQGVDDHVGFFSPGRWTAYGDDAHRVAQIYVHSKLLIADRSRALIGSANINARSLTGELDTEIGLWIEDAAKVSSFQDRLVEIHLGSPPAAGQDLLSAFRAAASRREDQRRIWEHPLEDRAIWGFISPPFAEATTGLPDIFFLLRADDQEGQPAPDEDRHGLTEGVEGEMARELFLVEEACFPRRRFTTEQVEKTLGLAQGVPTLYAHRKAFLALEQRFAYAFRNCENWAELRRIKKHFYQVTDLISQRHLGVFDRQVAAADRLCYDLYERLGAGNCADRVITHFGRGGRDYYEIRPPAGGDLPVFVSLPTGAVNCVWKWTALGHEMGHQVFHESPIWREALEEALADMTFDVVDMAKQVAHWDDELFADFVAIAQFGPAAALNLYALDRLKPQITLQQTTDEIPDCHPPLLLRARLAEKVLRCWGLSRRARGELPELPDFDEITVRGGNKTNSVPPAALERDLARLAETVVATWQELPRWTADDQRSVGLLKRRVHREYRPDVKSRRRALLDSGEAARHLVAAGRLVLHEVACEQRHPSHRLLQFLHDRVVGEIENA